MLSIIKVAPAKESSLRAERNEMINASIATSFEQSKRHFGGFGRRHAYGKNQKDQTQQKRNKKIINIAKQNLEEAYNEIKTIATNGGKFLFVGTKKQSGEVCVEEALRSNSYYVTERWLGGTLTNFRTIRKRINRLDEIEKMEKDGVFEQLPKKEVVKIRKEYEKLNKYLCGIRNMKKVPEALIIVDPRKEINAIREARRLHIPVFGIVDTNCDPDDVDYVIPANDDAIRAVKVVMGVLNNAVAEVYGCPMIDFVTEDEKHSKKEKSEVKEEVKNVEKENEELKQEVRDEVKEEAQVHFAEIYAETLRKNSPEEIEKILQQKEALVNV